ncbi:hypothetical protein IWW38_003932 [Coemansia aciculifera]|uniref:Uncharacterized protein n=1 Tax=Coemansia aciculifera TaxID=417176 RepID=A0ACC1LZE3_9FUNG|nr:hypothetical protein IWW38_003932 [Coemansia aciculifera]
MGKPSKIVDDQKQKKKNDVTKVKDMDKARCRVAKIEKKLEKLAAMTEDECERQARRKMKKDGGDKSADAADKKKLAKLKAKLYKKALAKRSKREARLARLKENIAAAESTIKTDPESNSSAAAASGGGWNNWAAAEFESEERKAKFLRLLGVKNGGGGASGRASPYASAITKDGGSKIQEDLEKQFQAGVQMRLQAQRGGRGGLGM